MASLPDMVVKHRFLGFLIWQSIPSTIIFFLFKAFLSTISSTISSTNTTRRNPPALSLAPWLIGFFTFFTFHLSQLLFSASLSLISSPQLDRPASPLLLAVWLLRFVVVLISGSDSSSLASIDFRRRVKVSLNFVLFAIATAISGCLAVVSIYWVKPYSVDEGWLIQRVGLKGFGMGLFYGLFYIYRRRWGIEFPIIQRPPFFSFKMSLPSAITQTLKLVAIADLFSAALVVFLPDELKIQFTVRKFITDWIIFYIGSFAVFLCWETSHHLHRVLVTKRFTFAPPKGSAAAETNPSEYLLLALEKSTPRSLLQYLAYLDLCMVCENNVATWRRAAFFEETGETYKRIVAVCLRPLDQLALKLDEGFGINVDRASELSKQLLSPTYSHVDSKYYEPLNDFQLYAWCARAVSSLTSLSHKEDSFGVAQLSGSNTAVISTLLSCLLAVEALMGKKTNLQPPHHLSGPAGIKWATSSTGKVDFTSSKKKSPHHSKAYAIADVLRTSIYQIVSTFHDEMVTSAKSGNLEKDWIISSKPPFGTRELLLQKLHFFLDFVVA